jgi:hypothetical protein
MVLQDQATHAISEDLSIATQCAKQGKPLSRAQRLSLPGAYGADVLRHCNAGAMEAFKRRHQPQLVGSAAAGWKGREAQEGPQGNCTVLHGHSKSRLTD